MARRVTGRVAGEHVIASAMAFSDSLLDDEEACFASIEHAVGDGLVSREREIRAAVARHGGDQVRLLSDVEMMDNLTAAWQRVCARAERDVVLLLDAALRKGLASIRAELEWCEKSLALRYTGTTERAMTPVEEGLRDIRFAEMATWAAVTVRSREELRLAVRNQLRVATDIDNLLLRLFSPVPAGLHGFGGRGVWWQVSGLLSQTARHIAIHSSNTVRSQAMELFNAECERVDDEGR